MIAPTETKIFESFCNSWHYGLERYTLKNSITESFAYQIFRVNYYLNELKKEILKSINPFFKLIFKFLNRLIIKK
jgi:hypothetical protein